MIQLRFYLRSMCLVSLAFAASTCAAPPSTRLATSVVAAAAAVGDAPESNGTAFETLNRAVRLDRAGALREVILHARSPSAEPADDGRLSLSAVVFFLGCFAYSPSELLDVCVPLLEGGDEAAGGVARLGLSLIDLDDPDGTIAAAIDARVERHQPVDRLVEFLVSERSDAAFVAMSRTSLVAMTEKAALVYLEHLVGDAAWRWTADAVCPPDSKETTAAIVAETRRRLEEASHSRHWWVRRYVLDIMNTYPTLAVAGVQTELARDPDARVRSGGN